MVRGCSNEEVLSLSRSISPSSDFSKKTTLTSFSRICQYFFKCFTQKPESPMWLTFSIKYSTFSNIVPTIHSTPFGLKKRSSTQSINKTSESPTLTRRDLLRDLSSDQNADEEFRYSTYDPHFRTSTSNFQRDRYRSSLQNMNELSIGNRNNQLRSTVQFGGRNSTGRYGTSITPQPTTRVFRQNGMTPG